MPPDLYALLGHTPLTSQSPPLHNAAFAALDIDARYIALASRSPESALSLARHLGLRGANVTAPFKEAIFRLVEPRGEARAIGAVNTLFFEGNRVLGANTDPVGVIGACHELGFDSLRQKRAAIVGTGGAARAAVFALLRQGALVTVIGRDESKARCLAHALGAKALALLKSHAARHAIESADLVVGAVSTRKRLFDPAWLSPQTAVLDALYGKPSQLVLDARERGCRAIDGQSWLFHQGAAAFELWTGQKAPIQVMRAGLGRHMARGNIRPRRGLAIVGFSGAGKSSLADSLSRRLALERVDLDREIERREGRTIPEIMAADGEAAFRERERATLRTLVDRPSILALGGGTLLDARNIPLVREERLVLWLDIDPATALRRLKPGSRPLLNAPPGMAPEAVAKSLFDARCEGYQRACDIVLDAALPTADTAEWVAELWSAHG